MMMEYAWVPHIHSEVVGLWSDSDVDHVSSFKERTYRFRNLFNGMDVDIIITEIDSSGHMVFMVNYDQLTVGLSVDVMESGLCRIGFETECDLDITASRTIKNVVLVLVVFFIGDDLTRGERDGRYDITDLLGSFGPVFAENEHDAAIQIFKSIVMFVQGKMSDIVDSGDDQLILFDMVGLLTRQLSYAKSFVSSVKSIVPDEYEGMMNTLDRYRQFIDDRFRTITVDGDVRREMGQRELNRFALSINRGMYYLSVLGIAVGMFGASIVADCIGFLGTTSKAIIISVTSSIVLAVCWRICSRRSDGMEDVISPSLERSL